MKFRSLTIIALLSLFFSCNNELEVNSEWQDITVVYGILNPSQDTNYIRVQRGYLGTEAARNSFDKPDSLYYDTSEIDVILNWFAINSNSSRGDLQGSVELPVDFSKKLNDNGPFTTEGFRLYRIPSDVPIENTYEYEVRVIKKNGGPDTYASTRIVTPFRILQPLPNGNPPRFNGHLNWRNELNSNIQVYQPYYHFYYKEYDIITKQSEIKRIDYKYETVSKKSGDSDYKLAFSPVDVFFNYIADKIPDDPNKLRFFEKIDFTIWGTDEVLYTYMNLQTPSEGINQNRPDYTNVHNGIGIFSSRINVELKGAILNEAGTPSFNDYLQKKQVMCDKRFTSFRGGDTCICNNLGSSLPLKCPYDL